MRQQSTIVRIGAYLFLVCLFSLGGIPSTTASDSFRVGQQVEVYQSPYGWVQGTYRSYYKWNASAPHQVSWRHTWTRGNAQGTASGTGYFGNRHIRTAKSSRRTKRRQPTRMRRPKDTKGRFVIPKRRSQPNNLAAPTRRWQRTIPKQRSNPSRRRKYRGSKMIQGILQVHNKARREVGVPSMVWDARIAEYAQQWANYLATRVKGIRHRPRRGIWAQRYGENLAAAGGTLPRTNYGRKGSLQWYAEKAQYGGEPVTGANLHQVGHYTQMVWRQSRRIGCGTASYKQRGFYWTILVCNYDPTGNYTGQTPY